VDGYSGHGLLGVQLDVPILVVKEKLEKKMSDTVSTIRRELRRALKALMLRGMRRSAGWCAELLQNLASDAEASVPVSMGEDLEERVSDMFLVAKSYFDMQEYARCAWTLGKDGQFPSPEQPDFFLWAYSTYLSGEKRKEEAIREGTANATNDAVMELIEILQGVPRDAFAEWLYGVCLKERGGVKAEAKAALIHSVSLFPYNWSAWLDLFQLCPNVQVLQEVLNLTPDSWPKRFFHVHGLLELQNDRDALDGGYVERLCEQFPRSPFAIAQKAMMYYGLTDYDTAQVLFDELTRMDPYRLTNVAAFSDLLFVKEARAELSHLAHRVFRVDRYRAESCCVVGNYYGLKGQHDRAVTYFKRALQANRNFQAALILLGHEYIELQNIPAALETYRQAAEASPSDHRAWYGLGHVYELNRMFYYSLYYYNKAKSLRPYDPRMWCALGNSYENLDMDHLAIKCYERAEANDDKEGIAVRKLAKLFEKSKEKHTAAKYYLKHLDRRMREGLMLTIPIAAGGDLDYDGEPCAPTKDDQDALKFLVLYFRDEGRLDEAQIYAENFLRIAGNDQEAQPLLKDIQARKNARDTKRQSLGHRG